MTILAPVVAALAALHDAGFVHERLGQSSVRFDAGGRPVLTGLGALRDLPPVGASRVPALRADYLRLGVLIRGVFDRLDPRDPAWPAAEQLADWFDDRAADVPFRPGLDELERRLFGWAPATAVRLPGVGPAGGADAGGAGAGRGRGCGASRRARPRRRGTGADAQGRPCGVSSRRGGAWNRRRWMRRRAGRRRSPCRGGSRSSTCRRRSGRRWWPQSRPTPWRERWGGCATGPGVGVARCSWPRCWPRRWSSRRWASCPGRPARSRRARSSRREQRARSSRCGGAGHGFPGSRRAEHGERRRGGRGRAGR